MSLTIYPNGNVEILDQIGKCIEYMKNSNLDKTIKILSSEFSVVAFELQCCTNAELVATMIQNNEFRGIVPTTKSVEFMRNHGYDDIDVFLEKMATPELIRSGICEKFEKVEPFEFIRDLTIVGNYCGQNSEVLILLINYVCRYCDDGVICHISKNFHFEGDDASESRFYILQISSLNLTVGFYCYINRYHY